MMAKAAGQPKSPLLWPPRQRPTLQIRNVVDHLTEEYQMNIRCKMRNAYSMLDPSAAN